MIIQEMADNAYINSWVEFCKLKGFEGTYVTNQKENNTTLYISEDMENNIHIYDKKDFGMCVEFKFGNLVDSNKHIDLFVEFTRDYISPSSPMGKLTYRVQELCKKLGYSSSVTEKEIKLVYYRNKDNLDKNYTLVTNPEGKAKQVLDYIKMSK